MDRNLWGRGSRWARVPKREPAPLARWRSEVAPLGANLQVEGGSAGTAQAVTARPTVLAFDPDHFTLAVRPPPAGRWNGFDGVESPRHVLGPLLSLSRFLRG